MSFPPTHAETEFGAHHGEEPHVTGAVPIDRFLLHGKLSVRSPDLADMSLKLQLLLENSYQLIIFIALMYLAVRYFERSRDNRKAIKLTAAIMAPSLGFSLVDFALLMNMDQFPLDSRATSMSGLLIIGMVFLVLWRGFRLNLSRSVFLTVVYVVIETLTWSIYGIVRPLLPPYGGYQRGDRITSSLIQLGVLVLPFMAWGMARLAKVEIRPVVACFFLAILFAPVILIGHGGVLPVPASIVWAMLFSSGFGSGYGMLMLPMALFSVGITTGLLLLLYRYMQRFRTPDGGIASTLAAGQDG